MASVDVNLENLMSHMGEFGRYQLFQFMLHILGGLTAGLHMVSLSTIAAVPSHHCSESFTNSTSNEITKQSECSFTDVQTNRTFECTEWTYDTSYYTSSIGMGWNFVCESKWKGAVAQSAYMLGVLVGSASMGSLADKYGRKIIFCLSGTAQLIFGLVAVLIGAYGEYYTWVIARCLMGSLGAAGPYLSGFVLAMEIVGSSKRTICGMLYQIAYASGMILVAFWGAFIKNSTWLQVIYALHAVLLLPQWWILDESPRWLWAQGRCKEAFDIVQKALRVNGKNIDLELTKFTSKSSTRAPAIHGVRSHSWLDLLKTPNLRKRFLNICLNWSACAVAYFGMTLSMAEDTGNPYWNLALSALVEIPGDLLAILTMEKLGRRFSSSGSLLTGGLCCLVVVFLTSETEAKVLTLVGKGSVALSYAVIANYTAELFPTVLRNTAVGIGTMISLGGAALTPLLLLLNDSNPSIPPIVFGGLAILSGLSTLFLPETAGRPMPESLQDGEEFGIGDNCFTTCLGRRKKTNT